MKENIIEVKNVGIRFERKASILKAKESREFWALHDVSFNIERSEVLGIVGRNGAGKSTLLTLLAGIIAPTTGEIISYARHVSLLSLQAGFVPFLSGRKNIILSGMLMGLSKKGIQDKVQEVIEFSELGDFIDEPVINYSAGMKTRLGFSTAMHIDPDVILIDEVLGVGDASFREKSSKVIKEKLQGNTTAIIVSHSEELVRDLCDRIVLIENGKNVFCGDVDTGYQKYN